MVRKKTKIEMAESPQEQADRLRQALFVLSGMDDPGEMKRIARAAMGGEKHGYDRPTSEEIDAEAKRIAAEAGHFMWEPLDGSQQFYYRMAAETRLMNRHRPNS